MTTITLTSAKLFSLPRIPTISRTMLLYLVVAIGLVWALAYAEAIPPAALMPIPAPRPPVNNPAILPAQSQVMGIRPQPEPAPAPAPFTDDEQPGVEQQRADPAGCSAETVMPEPAYHDPDWWEGAIEYGFP